MQHAICDATLSHLAHSQLSSYIATAADFKAYDDLHALLAAALQGEFNDEVDFFYNAYTTTDCLTFEDCHEDWTPFSKLYLQRWQQQGVEGIKQLRARCNDNLTSLMRGLDGKKLEHAWSDNGPRVSGAFALMVYANLCSSGFS
jgi:hypothetical protein